MRAAAAKPHPALPFGCSAGTTATCSCCHVPQTPMHKESVICCRICGTLLCQTGELLQDEINANANCGSFFLDSPCEWMEEAASSTEGKLMCPGCNGRVGRISWIGFEAIDGRWITPAIMITKSRADFKWRDCAERTALEFQDKPEAESEVNCSDNPVAVTELCTDTDIAALSTSTMGSLGVPGCLSSEESNVLQACPTPDLEMSNLGFQDEKPNIDPSSTADSLEAPRVSDGSDEDLSGGSDEDNETPIDAQAPVPSVGGDSAAAGTSALGTAKRIYTKNELATMDMMDLVKLLDAGDIEMDDLIEACDEAAARKKEEMKRTRDLTNPQVLMAAIKEEIADDDDWGRLRRDSGCLRRGEMTCAEYYAGFAAVFARLDREGLFMPLVDTLPDQDKRQEIRRLHGNQRQPAASTQRAR